MRGSWAAGTAWDRAALALRGVHAAEVSNEDSIRKGRLGILHIYI